MRVTVAVDFAVTVDPLGVRAVTRLTLVTLPRLTSALVVT